MLNVGMVGMGGISRSHISAWLRIPEAKVVSVCDIRAEKADAAAKATGARAYLDFEDMLKNESFDILDICLPTYLHADFAVRALNAGKHVITEKPISLKREDVARIYDAAKKNDRRFMVAQVLRFWREYCVLKDAYDSGRYGKLLSGRMTRLGNTPKWSWDGWMRDPARSGMVPFDLHIHDLDFMVYAFGKPESLSCSRAGNSDQDYINAVYKYPDFFICAEAAWFNCDFKFSSAFRFQFEHAVLDFNGKSLVTYLENGETHTLEPETGAENGLDLPDCDAYYNEIRYFTNCVLNHVPCDMVRQGELETVLELIGQL